jgi:hypothetical protein
MNYLTAWRKGDLVRLESVETFRLTSDGYKKEPGRILCDTDRGKAILYTALIHEAYLVEDVYGKKNKPCK